MPGTLSFGLGRWGRDGRAPLRTKQFRLFNVSGAQKQVENNSEIMEIQSNAGNSQVFGNHGLRNEHTRHLQTAIGYMD